LSWLRVICRRRARTNPSWQAVHRACVKANALRFERALGEAVRLGHAEERIPFPTSPGSRRPRRPARDADAVGGHPSYGGGRVRRV